MSIIRTLMNKKMKAAKGAAGLAIILFLWLFLPVVGQTPAVGHEQEKQQDLTYEVSVRAQIVPVFAVDSKGNPIYDLKEEEIEFFVNGKPAKIETFVAFTFQEEEKETIETKKIKAEDITPKIKRPSPDRINFLILDSMMVSEYGLKRSLKISTDIVNRSSENDAFIILTGTPHKGLTYISGPEKDKKKIIAALADAFTKKAIYGTPHITGVNTLYKKRNRVTYSTLSTALTTNTLKKKYNSGSTSSELRQRMAELSTIEEAVGVKEYERMVAIFNNALVQLKYALKTITLPKNVYLITGGLSKKAQTGLLTIRYYDFLKKAAVAINQGGSMLYLINPNRMLNVQMNDALKFMAEVSGGKCFYGPNAEDIVTQVKNTTSAYYELSFFPDQHSKDKLKVKLKCKRKGVTLHTINYSERAKPYKDMPVIQKKLFALNVVTGGSWSRMVGKVGQTSYKKRKSTAANIKNIEMKIPAELRNQESDIYVLNLDPKTLKAAIAVKTKLLDQKETIAVPVQKGKNQFVVVVEPVKTRCVFTAVK